MFASRCFDISLIHRAITDPQIYPYLVDDGCPSADEFDPPLIDSLIYVRIDDGGEFMGVFVYCPQNSVCYEVHTCLLPVAWGRSSKCAKASLAWMFENTDCERVITNVPAPNRLALRLAKAAGFTQFGVNTKSFLKDGVLHDQIMLGINKGALCR